VFVKIGRSYQTLFDNGLTPPLMDKYLCIKDPLVICTQNNSSGFLVGQKSAIVVSFVGVASRSTKSCEAFKV